MVDLARLGAAVLEGNARASVEVVKEALAEGVDPLVLIQEQMIPAMDEVGRLFEAEEYFVPELLLSARAMKGALEILRPLLAERGVEPAGRVVIGTVQGDLHDIGKNLVGSLLEGGGFEVVDLGTDVSPERFIEAVRERGAQVVCLSALLTVTMPSMRRTIEAMREAGVRERVKVLVGGAPVTPQYAEEIGADGYGESASAAVGLARRFCVREVVG
jgi:corrinoid protein of di/trimethylamine methyltransferase